jgi:hypothetical protein
MRVNWFPQNIAFCIEFGYLIVLLTEDFASPPLLDCNRISVKFLPIFSMLEKLDAVRDRNLHQPLL